MWRPLIVACTLVMVTGPAGTLLAEMSTLLKSLAASWVRNGKPSIVTDGLTGSPFDWNWLAMSFSVTASATRSPMTRMIRITMTANTAMTERRTRRLRVRRRNRGDWPGGGTGGCAGGGGVPGWGGHSGG